MDNLTITDILNQNNYVLSDGTFRVAKLNNDTKRPHIANYWEKNKPNVKKLEEASQILQNVGSKEYSYDIVLGRLSMTTEGYSHYANVNGFRKLKVNDIVREKTKKAYENYEKEELPIVEKNEQVFEVPKEEAAPTPAPSIVPQEEKSEMSIRGDGLRRQEFTNPLPESRMSRLEKTGEVPKINANNDQRVQQMNYDERPSLSRVERRMNDDYQNQEKVEVGKGEKDLNRIQAFSPLGNGSKNNMSELKEAYDKAFDNYAASEKRKKDSREEVIALERQIQEAKELLEEKQKEQIAELNARTRANEEETLGYTMHSEDLRAQLEELRAQLNSGTMRR